MLLCYSKNYGTVTVPLLVIFITTENDKNGIAIISDSSSQNDSNESYQTEEDKWQQISQTLREVQGGVLRSQQACQEADQSR